MPSSCVVCKDTTSRPVNFLLACTLCHSFWHHRCHNPPIQDQVLLNIVKKFNQDRKTNPAAALAWSCDPCQKKKSGSSSRTPILVDDDDDIVILDSPPKEEKSAEIAGKSTNTRPNVQNHPTTRQGVDPATHSSAVQSTGKPVVAKKTIVSSDHRQPMGKPFSTKSTGPSGQENSSKSTAARETGIRIIGDPFPAIPDLPVPSGLIRPPLVQKSSSSSGLVSGLVHLSMDDQEMDNSDLSTMNDDDDPLEYLTPPPLPPPVTPPLRGSDHHGVGVGGAKTLSTPHKAGMLIQTQSISNSEGVQEIGLLPSWINVRHSAPGAEPDIWQRALAMRTRTQLAARSNSSIARVGVSEETQATQANARRKVKAKPLNELKVERSFFFSADAWMNQTRVGLDF